MKKIIHVNRANIAFNAKADQVILPTYIVREGKKRAVYGYGVKINGPSILVDTRRESKEKLDCGARAWIETEADIEVEGPMDFQESEHLKKVFAGD